ncbi:MAG: hypothetical protein JWM93_958 [Frankiales bacterium]|nr:hypothetical protein [Frankiales bacterium]
MTHRPTACEATTIARRFAAKLDADHIALVGTVTPDVVIALHGAVAVAGYDSVDRCNHAASIIPGGTWKPLEAAAAPEATETAPLVLISVSALQTLGNGARVLLASACMTLVVDLEATLGDGAAALARIRQLVEALGGEPLRSELIAPQGSASHRRTSPIVAVAGTARDRAAWLAATGLQSLRLDPATAFADGTTARARVCIVSYEVVGPVRNGGIGTANTSLALALARSGHDVTLLYTGEPSSAEEYEHWRSRFGERGVSYAQLDVVDDGERTTPTIAHTRAWEAYKWVHRAHLELPFDVIHSPECQGHGAYIGLAKRHGLAFADAHLVVGVHSTTRWCAEANLTPRMLPMHLINEHQEQLATATADIVISPSGYLLSYLRNRGWTLPARTFVQPYAVAESLRDAAPVMTVPDAPPTELVFFGRLETRKGLEVFCDALDRLSAMDVPACVSVTFLGSNVLVAGEPSRDYIAKRAERWSWPVRVETELDQPEAVAYLGEHDCVAVMPSLVDNSPNTVYEALALGVPFIASRAGGTGELIAAEDLDRVTFAAWPAGDAIEPFAADAEPPAFDVAELAEKLHAALSTPAVPARRAVDGFENEQTHAQWHAALAATVPEPRPQAPWPTLAIITVDEPLSAANSVTPAGADVDVVHVTQRPLGAALNGAVHTTIADLLLFLPEAMTPDPALADLVRQAAARSAAAAFVFVASDTDGVELLPLGGPAALGACYPFTRHNGFAIRADALRAAGGFTAAVGDWFATDLLNRIVLGGAEVDVIPAVLGRRTTPEPFRAEAGADWIAEATRWGLPPDQERIILRPFYQASLPDLAGLLRRSQELFHDQRAQLTEANREAVEWGAKIWDLYQESDTRAGRLEHRVNDATRHRAHADAELRRLRKDLHTAYTSRSWRLTRPLRRLTERLKSRRISA